MAAINNRRSATVHPDPPLPHPATEPPFLLRRCLFQTLRLIVYAVLILAFSVFIAFLIRPLIPKPPILHLTAISVSPLFNTTAAATWNISLQVSNPNRISSNFYDHFLVWVFYVENDNRGLDSLSVPIAEADIGSLAQKSRTQLQLQLSVSIKNVASNTSVVRKIIEDQKRGMVRIQVSVSFFMEYAKGNQNWMLMKFVCRGLNIVFEKSSRNNTGSELGIVSDLPRECELVSD